MRTKLVVAVLFCVMLSERGRNKYMIRGNGEEGLLKKLVIFLFGENLMFGVLSVGLKVGV